MEDNKTTGQYDKVRHEGLGHPKREDLAGPAPPGANRGFWYSDSAGPECVNPDDIVAGMKQSGFVLFCFVF